MNHAIVVRSFGISSCLNIELLGTLPVISPAQVRIRISHAGVNPVDTYIRAGTYAVLPALPYTPGFDACGTIIAMGSAVHRPDLAVGQRVWCCRSVTGTYASEAICEASTVAPAPDNLTNEEVACVGVASMTACLALFEHAKAQPGETVLIHGASGGVGLACVQLARAAGCMVIATAGSQAGLNAAHKAGAHMTLNHLEPEAYEKLLAGKPHAGVHVIIEMLANVNLPRDTNLLAPRGRIVVVGNRGEVVFNPRSLMAKDAKLIGMNLMNATDEQWVRSMWRVNASLANGTFKPHVAKVLALADAPLAHDMVMTNGKVGKIVLQI